jgi:hypothetical protein
VWIRRVESRDEACGSIRALGFNELADMWTRDMKTTCWMKGGDVDSWNERLDRGAGSFMVLREVNLALGKVLDIEYLR